MSEELMKKYYDIKEKYPDRVLLFRVGDFYESYDEDAAICGEVLSIIVTRHKSLKGRDGHYLRIAGFPHHSLDRYLPQLIRAGHRVAINEDFKDAKIKEFTQGENSEDFVYEEISIPQAPADVPINHQEEIERVKREAQKKILDIASETIKALNGKLPTTLNTYFAKAIGELTLIKLKNNLGAEITKNEMSYLIELAEKGLAISG